MKKLRWRRIIGLLIILIILGGLLNYCVRLVTSGESDKAQSSTPVVSTQKIDNKNPSPSQKRDMIDIAKKQAIAAARASGQSADEANQFGQLAAQSMEDNLDNSAKTGTQ